MLHTLKQYSIVSQLCFNKKKKDENTDILTTAIAVIKSLSLTLQTWTCARFNYYFANDERL